MKLFFNQNILYIDFTEDYNKNFNNSDNKSIWVF